MIEELIGVRLWLFHWTAIVTTFTWGWVLYRFAVAMQAVELLTAAYVTWFICAWGVWVVMHHV